MDEDWRGPRLAVSVEIPWSERETFQLVCRRLGLTYFPIEIQGFWRPTVTYWIVGGAGLDELQQRVVELSTRGHRGTWKIEGFCETET
jgi:hypothetical protein